MPMILGHARTSDTVANRRYPIASRNGIHDGDFEINSDTLADVPCAVQAISTLPARLANASDS